MSLSKLTEIALRIDSSNRNLNDGDLIEANKRYHPSPTNTVGSQTQWSYKDAYTALLVARAMTEYSVSLIEGATTYVYSQYTETLSGNPWFGGQEVRQIDYNRLDSQRTMSFYEVIGRSHQNRRFDAKDLILNNLNWIASAPSVTDAGSPVSSYSKCTRDIEFFLEAIANDLVRGGNSRVYDYAWISREALVNQANSEGRTIEAIADDYVIALKGTSDGSATDESVLDRLESVVKGSADPDNNGTTLLQESNITEAEDNCIDVVLSCYTFIDLILDLIRKGPNSVVHRSNPFGDQEVGMGRLHDASKLMTEENSATYDDGNGNVGIKGWIVTPPSISDTNKFDPDKCPRDLGYFLEAIAHDLVRGGNYQTHDYAQQSRNALIDQSNKSGESRSYEEIVSDYELAINGSSDGIKGLRYRLVQVLQGTAILGTTPLDISSYDITPANDLCSDVIAAIHAYLDIILLILKQGPQSVPQNPTTSGELDTLFSVPDNRQGESIYKKAPYSYNGKQISKCIRDVEYYVRYLTYGLVANDFGIIDDLFLNGLTEINKAFDLQTSWYKDALFWIRQELIDNKESYFGSGDLTVEMPSDSSKTFTIGLDDKVEKAKEFIDYVRDRI